MTPIKKRLEAVNKQVNHALNQFQRTTGSVQLLAVSKTRPSRDILEALDAGQQCFGESYLQEALDKIEQLASKQIQWHFIGRIQGNKTRAIAEHFDWVHSVDKIKYAKRLNDQRPANLPPLNICLQINIDQEESKAGITPQEAAQLIGQIETLPQIRLRGLMTLPAPAQTLEAQRLPFKALRELRDGLATRQVPLETLSMGMSGDLEAAIAEGATIIRVGTGIFGPRSYPAKP